MWWSEFDVFAKWYPIEVIMFLLKNNVNLNQRSNLVISKITFVWHINLITIAIITKPHVMNKNCYYCGVVSNEALIYYK